MKIIRNQKKPTPSILVYYKKINILYAKSRNRSERDNTSNTARTDDSSAESIEQLKAKLSTKYDKQKEVISDNCP